MSELKTVEYKTFVQHLNQASIEDLKIYNYASELEITYSLDGELYATKGPYGAAEDDLLFSVLDNKKITYIVLNEEHGGSSSSLLKNAEIASLVFILVPLVLIAVIVIQALTIKKLVAGKD